MPVRTSNWRPLLLCALLISQKVWNDADYSSNDFSSIYPFFMRDDIINL